ncbi:phosphopantetheine-binding protein [Spirillospora sp. NPDC047279]|uniref:acyl carrier protein n=1 Tax=Spirillospora sp. NPDC047279 TaxID=3155478 RepID=UPI0033E91996
MNEQIIADKYVKTYDLDVRPEDLGSDEPLFGPQSIYGLDSMDVLRFIAALAEEYDIELAAIKTDTFRTLRSITAFLNGEEG